MTIEEAREAIKEAYGNSEYTNEIIKALEQEPCDDCISRQTVLEVLKNNRYRFNISQEGYCEGKVLWSENLIKEDARKEIEQLPPVTPKEKTGKWIEIKSSKDTTIALRCSCCGNSPKRGISSDYCPNCGAKMKEVEE